MIDTLIGSATEGSGASELAKMRKEIPSDRLRDTLSRLVRIDRTREKIDLTLARERAYLDRADTWQRRWSVALCRLTGRGDLESESAVRAVVHRRDAHLRLLIVDIAIRLFQDETGRLLESLNELSPDVLSDVPLDPFAERLFVYRRESNGFILYSVGADRVDNGGKLMTSNNRWQDEGFDYDLDFAERKDLPSGPQ